MKDKRQKLFSFRGVPPFIQRTSREKGGGIKGDMAFSSDSWLQTLRPSSLGDAWSAEWIMEYVWDGLGSLH